MSAFRIKTVNAIAPEGLEQLGQQYEVSTDEDKPDGILVRSSKIDVNDYPGLLAVARAGAGVNNITVEKATDKGICVFNTPGANANAVVDLVFPMIGVWMRNIYRGIKFCESLKEIDSTKVGGEVERRKTAFRGVEIAGKNLGVVGLGQIGIRLANGGVYRHMHVRGFDPNPSLDNIHQLLPDVRVTRSLKETIGNADVVSLHIPLSPGTTNMVDEKFIAGIKKGAILVNYARGPIVDEAAVLEALNSGHLECYITDFPTPENIGHPKVLTTPHLGASTSESEEKCAVMAVEELSAYLEYGNIVHSVNFPNIASIPARSIHSRLIVINKDVPGMIAFVSNIIGKHGINIGSYLNESNGDVGYNIIDLEAEMGLDVIEEIEVNEDVIRTRLIRIAEI